MLKECTLLEALQCKEEDTLVTVAKKLREYAVRYIYVMNAQEQLAGVISMSDINNRVAAEGKDPKLFKAKDIMTKNIKVYDDEMDEREAYKQCVQAKLTACPVVSKGKLVGVVTVQELLNRMTHVE